MDDKEARKAEKKARKAAEAAAASADSPEISGKKRKRAEDEEEAVAEPPADREETEEERAARKAAKKAAKRAKKEAEEAEKAEEAADASDGEGKKEKKEKKEKKDKKEKKEKKEKRERSEEPEEDEAPAAGSSSRSSSSISSGWPCYTMSAEVAALSPSQVSSFHKDKSISVEDPLVKGGRDADAAALAWKPVTEFSYARSNFGEQLMTCTAGFKQPSPIQSQAWPILLSGRDMIGIAATGSGKTLAFTLPALKHIAARKAYLASAAGKGVSFKPRTCYPTVLVLAPTRELAMQTAKVSLEAGKPLGLQTVVVFGGMPKYAQKEELLSGGGTGAPFVVATPGRLLDLVTDGVINLSCVTFLVLDEADRMLDMGFEKDIRNIIAQLPASTAASAKGLAGVDGSTRQTLMFSATWPPAIQSIAAEFLATPVKVVVGSAELAASSSVTQVVEVVEPRDKDGILQRLLSKYHASRKNRVLVFALYKKEADRLERSLKQKGWNCGAIHGDMSQEARIRAFNAFKDGKVPLLIATDVAARGLDIPNVEYVINYTFPLTIEDYVHRIGRTGRGGATGTAHTLFTALDKAHAGELANVLKEAGVDIPEGLTKFGLHVKKKEHSLYGAHFKADGPAGAGAMPAAPTKMKFDDDE